MKLLKRIGYYLIGLSLGSVVVLFIWKGKDVRFDYGPNARTLSSIRKKVLTISDNVDVKMKQYQIDTTTINALLFSGEVKFGKSKPRLKPCAEYYISGDYKNKKLDFYVQRCDSIATITELWLKD